MRVAVTSRGTGVAVNGGGLAVRISAAGVQGRPGPVSPKGVAIEWPANGEEATLAFVPYAATLQDARAVVRGAGSAVVELWHGHDREAGTMAGSVSVDATTGGTELVITAPDAVAGSFVWMRVASVTGQVRELHLSMWF